MSGRVVLVEAGLGATDFDLQGIAQGASTGEDRALALLAFPGGADGTNLVRRVVPLHDELRTPPTISGTVNPMLNNPRLLAVRASFLGGPAGYARVLPFAMEVYPASVAGANPDAQATPLAVMRLETPTNVGPFSSSAAGRVDTIYARCSYYVPSDGRRARRMKDPATGSVTTQSTNVYADPQVQLLVAPGTEGSGTPGAVPADGGGSYNVAIATVSLPAGYASPGALIDGGGEGIIRQVWERGGVRSSAVKLARPGRGMAFTNADAGVQTDVPNASRGCEYGVVRAVFRNTAAAAVVVLDAGIDWRNRMVRVSIIRPVAHAPSAPFGVYPPPGVGLLGGGQSVQYDTGWVFTGGGITGDLGGDVAGDSGAFAVFAGPPAIRLFANNTTGGGEPQLGALCLRCTDAPTDGGGGGDHYVVVAEYLSSDVEAR